MLGAALGSRLEAGGPVQERCRVVANRVVAPEHNLLTVATVEIGRRARAGQFAQIRVPGDAVFLPRPFSFLAAAEDHCQFLSRAVGPGTRALAEVAPGTELELLGPLGQGFDLAAAAAADEVILVGGGVGVPPLVHAAAELAPHTGTALIGAVRGDLLLGVEELTRLGWQVQVATDDGSRGHHGLVTDLVQHALERAAGTSGPAAAGSAPNPELAAGIPGSFADASSSAANCESAAGTPASGRVASGSAANRRSPAGTPAPGGVASNSAANRESTSGTRTTGPGSAPFRAVGAGAASGSAANHVPPSGEAGVSAAACSGSGSPPRAVLVLACGPHPMLRRCAELAGAAEVACQVALEEPMACGFGVCLGCAIRVRAPAADGAAGIVEGAARAAYALVCRDGPVFAAERVVW